MRKIRVHFEVTSGWAADMDWDELQELAADNEGAGDGDFRCPPAADIAKAASYDVTGGQIPGQRLAEELLALGFEVDSGPIRISGIAKLG